MVCFDSYCLYCLNVRMVTTVSGADKLKEWKMNMWRMREADKGIKSRRNWMKDEDMKEVVYH